MARIDYYRVAPGGVKVVRALEQYLRASELEPALIELVKLRASLMNGCGYCVDLHTKEARAKGETEQRLFAVPVWRETPFFSPRERAALAWTEAVTEIGRSGVSDALYDEARAQFYRQGTGRLDRCRYLDQRMEPSRRDVPACGGQLQACGSHRGGFRLTSA
jgi:AhpD family alkylhydroperoxidase